MDLYEQWIEQAVGKKGDFITKDGKVIFVGGPGGGGGEAGGGGGVTPIKSKDKIESTERKVINAGTLKPTKSAKFAKASTSEAMTSAVRSSAFYNGETVYVFPTYSGWNVSVPKPSLPFNHPYSALSATYDKGSNAYTVDVVRFVTQ
jgi:hypothetical protein